MRFLKFLSTNKQEGLESKKVSQFFLVTKLEIEKPIEEFYLVIFKPKVQLV
jgi:hypothetical protein